MMNWIYTALLAVGCFFMFTATVGLFRMPDVFTRLHGTTKCDTVAAGYVLTSVALRSGSWLVAAKILLIFIFIIMVSPTSAHLIAWAAHQSDQQELKKSRAGYMDNNLRLF